MDPRVHDHDSSAIYDDVVYHDDSSTATATGHDDDPGSPSTKLRWMQWDG